MKNRLGKQMPTVVLCNRYRWYSWRTCPVLPDWKEHCVHIRPVRLSWWTPRDSKSYFSSCTTVCYV